MADDYFPTPDDAGPACAEVFLPLLDVNYPASAAESSSSPLFGQPVRVHKLSIAKINNFMLSPM